MKHLCRAPHLACAGGGVAMFLLSCLQTTQRCSALFCAARLYGFTSAICQAPSTRVCTYRRLPFSSRWSTCGAEARGGAEHASQAAHEQRTRASSTLITTRQKAGSGGDWPHTQHTHTAGCVNTPRRSKRSEHTRVCAAQQHAEQCAHRLR
jgi:hypothetical protein